MGRARLQGWQRGTTVKAAMLLACGVFARLPSESLYCSPALQLVHRCPTCVTVFSASAAMMRGCGCGSNTIFTLLSAAGGNGGKRKGEWAGSRAKERRAGARGCGSNTTLTLLSAAGVVAGTPRKFGVGCVWGWECAGGWSERGRWVEPASCWCLLAPHFSALGPQPGPPALYELSVPWPSWPYCGQPALHSLPSQSHMVKSTPQATLLHLDTSDCGRHVGARAGGRMRQEAQRDVKRPQALLHWKQATLATPLSPPFQPTNHAASW